MNIPRSRPTRVSRFCVSTSYLQRRSALIIGFILILGASRFWTSAVAAELPTAVAPGTHLIGEARIAYTSNSVSPEVGDISVKQVAIKADILFCRSSMQPSGTLSANFEGADMVMKASTLDWLVVSPKQIELRGPCILDASEGFMFQMKIEQGAENGKRHIRLKVWETAKPSHVVFDNQRDENWSAPFKSSGELVSGDLGLS